MKILDLIKPKIIENGTIIAYSGSNYLVKIGNSTVKAFGAKGFQVNDNVVIGDGNRPAPPIQDELITEEYMAVLRGQAFLDDNYYQKIKHSVKLPYVDIEDGQVVSLADDYYNLYGNYLVKQSDINITLEEDTLKIWLSLNIEKYRKVL